MYYSPAGAVSRLLEEATMNLAQNAPKALFLGSDGTVYPDNMICSGILPGQLGGKPCPYAENGRFPTPEPLDAEHPLYSPDKGKPGDLCPPCAKQQLAHLGHWQGYANQEFPQELLPLRLFKCRQWLWLVVPGLYDADAAQITANGLSQ
jgi:hypothetical protein